MPDANKSPQGRGIKTMNKNDKTVAELNAKTKEEKGNGKDQKKVDRKPESKKDERKVIQKIEPEVKPLSIEERLNRLNDLNDLVSKRNRLKESSTKLNSFDLKRENHSTEIMLTDEAGNRFQTSNTRAVDAFIQSTKETIEIELLKVEALIQF